MKNLNIGDEVIKNNVTWRVVDILAINDFPVKIYYFLECVVDKNHTLIIRDDSSEVILQ
jgi:hypothetical protein